MSAEPFPHSNPNWNFDGVESMASDGRSADYSDDEDLSEERDGDAEIVNGEEMSDPANLVRRIYADPFTRLEREIWRPGDGDGDQGTDYFDRIGLPLPLEQRWRLFQTDIGRIDARNQPPRFVILDDCAASQVLRSDIQKAKMAQNWPHDFGGGGRIRARRPHRGRAAIKDAAGEGMAKYYVTTVGGKKENYFFTGEPGFTPVFYHYEPPKPREEEPRKRKSEHPDDYNPRAHGHNQFTPKDLLVKHGAPSFSKKEAQIRAPRVNTLLGRDGIHLMPHGRSLHGGVVESTRYSIQHETEKGSKEIAMAREEEARRERAALRVEEEREGVRAARGTSPVFDADGTRGSANAGSFPIYRLNGLASIPDDFTLIQMPRDMNYAQRTAFEQNLAARILAGVHGQDDVTHLALKLSRAEIKISEQAQEIERLKEELAAM